MTELIEIHCAVWHPSLPSSDIVDAVKIAPTLSWSSGSINEKTGLIRDRTYCRFDLGSFSQEDLDGNLAFLNSFKALGILEGFNIGGKTAVYVRSNADVSEVYLAPAAIDTIHLLNAMLVFR